MKKDLKLYIVILAVIASILILIFFIKDNPPDDGIPDNTPIDKELAACIGQNSVLYIQLGCKFCKAQEELFGEYYQYLNKVDCAYEPNKCLDAGISGTPTWIIKNKIYEGVQDIGKLKKLTNC